MAIIFWINMENNNNIIAIRKRDVSCAHQAFVELMGKTEQILNYEAQKVPHEYKQLTSSTLEVCAVEKIKQACCDTPFDASEVKLISGQHFPDIVANKYYGIEVKSTKENHWTSTGSSIVESTRIVDVDDIFMLFGKLGGKVPQFRCRPYEDVLCDIAVTHSPRYLIDMELKKDETIFSKMGTTYHDFRTSSNAVSMARHYYRERAIKQNRQEMPWWLTEDNVERGHSFNIKLWSSLDVTEKRKLQAMCMILFPEALNPKRSSTKYNNITLWLCSYHQIVNPNIRDMYSAGGKITHVNGRRLDEPVAQVFNVIVDYAEEIKEALSCPNRELLLMIKEYNPLLFTDNNLYDTWLEICCEFASENNVPLRQWISEKPTFSFSK